MLLTPASYHGPYLNLLVALCAHPALAPLLCQHRRTSVSFYLAVHAPQGLQTEPLCWTIQLRHCLRDGSYLACTHQPSAMPFCGCCGDPACTALCPACMGTSNGLSAHTKPLKWIPVASQESCYLPLH